MENNIELLKQYIINKDFEKATNLINNSNLDLYLNIDILFLLSINNSFNYLFDIYLDYFKLNPENKPLINNGISISIESNNFYAFQKLIDNSDLDDDKITNYILLISSFFYNDMLNILIKKYPSFNLTSLTVLSIIINLKNHYFYSTIIKHMKNINEINEQWIEENINDTKNKQNIKKIIKIKTF
tara:strand:- start:1110 stop:1664 length:555 start_codon:yes stop_codon:yes gene_type:complete